MIVIFLPSTPPLAFHSSVAIWMPCIQPWPSLAMSPVSGPTAPMRISPPSAAGAAVPAAAVVGAAAAVVGAAAAAVVGAAAAAVVGAAAAAAVGAAAGAWAGCCAQAAPSKLTA